VKDEIEGGWSVTPPDAVKTFLECIESAAAESSSYVDIDAALKDAFSVAGIAYSESQANCIRSAVDTVRQESIDEAEAELVSIAGRRQSSQLSSNFHGPVGSVQIGAHNTATTARTVHDPPEPHILAENPQTQLEREARGEPRALRQHLEILLDPSLNGVIVREAEGPVTEPEDDTSRPDLRDPMGRILLSNVGRSTVVRLWLAMPIQILSASPFPRERNAYKKDEVIRHPVLVNVLRPGSLVLTITNRLASPIRAGIAPEAYDERDINTSTGWQRIGRPITVQTLYLVNVRGSSRPR
jgi:hypothetical protein